MQLGLKYHKYHEQNINKASVNSNKILLLVTYAWHHRTCISDFF